MGVLRGAAWSIAVGALAACGAMHSTGFVYETLDAEAATEAGVARSCRVAGDCDDDEYCLRLPGSCAEDRDAAPGTCVATDAGCALAHPLCACDGRIYADGCTLKASRQAVSYDGAACALPAGTFECDFEVCSSATDFCLADTGRACAPLPSACRAPDAGCGCFGISSPRCSCTWEDAGYFDVECAE